MDWTITGYSYDVKVDVIHQTNVDNTLGTLSGVQIDSMTITEGYYSDSRVQGKVSTVVKEGLNDGYVTNARLRIVMVIPSRDWSEEMLTGYVSGIKTETKGGYTKRTYTIEGTMWGLLNHKVKAPVTIAKGAKLMTVVTSLMSQQTKMQYSTAGFQDHVFGSTILYEAGTDLSTILFETNESYNRIDVDGHGRVTFKKYVAPSKQSPSRTIDYHGLRDLAKEGLTLELTDYDAPGRTVVVATVTENDKQKTIVGSYDAPSSHQTSINTRGYLISRQDGYSGTSESPTVNELNTIAKNNWTNAQTSGGEWSLDSVFANYHAGEVLQLIRAQGNPRKVLVKSVTTDFGGLSQELTLKDLGSTISANLNTQYY